MTQHIKWYNRSWVRLVFFLALLYVFFVAIGMMGAAFKLMGKGTAEALINATSNPFTGLLIGILATSLVQSSSATTSIVVGLVSGGALNISNAVPIIMGANIGTSVTNTIVSIGHIRENREFERAVAGATMHDFFNLMTVIILFPLELATGVLSKAGMFLAHTFTGSSSVAFNSPLKIIVKPTVKLIQNGVVSITDGHIYAAGVVIVVLSFVFLFFALVFIVRNMKAMMLDRLEVAIDRLFGANPLFAIFVGMIITSIIQSSSITTSLLVPLIGAGAMSLEAAFPVTIGANIGTTITALLASLAGDVNGLAIAFTHLSFNLLGTLVIYPIKFLRSIPIKLATMLGKMAVKDKRIAFAYIVFVFYVLPLIGFGISRLFED